MTKIKFTEAMPSKISFMSKRCRNMNCPNYVFVHNRLHVGICDGVLSAFVTWDDGIVSIPVDKSFADDFEAFECSFKTMFNILACLLVKAGTCPF